jgi:hypothetical protein
MDEHIAKKLFKGETLAVDGKRFEDCRFDEVTFTFGGGSLPTFSNCTFTHVALRFDSAAARTLMFLSGLRKGGFALAVDEVFNSVRQANL